MRVEIVALEPAIVAEVAARMRASDRQEIEGLGQSSEPEAVVAATAGTRFGAAALLDGRPAAAWGGIEGWPGVYCVWFLATDDWSEVWRPVVRWFRTHIPALMREAPAHKLWCWSAADHTAAADMLAAIRFTVEGTARAMGSDRRDYHLWGLVR